MLTNLCIIKNAIKLPKCDYLLHNIIKSVINAVDKKYQSFTLHKPCIDKSACCRYQSLWSCLVIGSSFLHQFQKSIFQKLILRDQREICFCRGNFVTRLESERFPGLLLSHFYRFSIWSTMLYRLDDYFSVWLNQNLNP